MTNSKASLPFRNYKPKRSKVQKRTRYQEYKSELRRDFKKKCGYCCDPDEFCGGMQGFHIDHFAPKSKFPNLISKYCNLVYSCPFCNGAKSAKWVGNDSSISHDGNKGFIDPCNSEYDRHLKRNANGQILGRTNWETIWWSIWICLCFVINIVGYHRDFVKIETNFCL